MTRSTGQIKLPPIDVFVSYRRKASGTLAYTLAKEMERRRIPNVFVDTRVTDGAGPFPERLLLAIEKCKVFVCLLGDDTFDSEWVRKEIAHAYRLGKPMIPVFQESYVPTPEPPTEAIGALLQYDGVKILDQTNLYVDEAFDRLANMLRKTPRPSQPHRPRWVFGLGIVALVAVLFMLAFMLRGGSGPSSPSATTLIAANPTSTNTIIATSAPTSTQIATPTQVVPTLLASPFVTPTPLPPTATEEPIETLIARIAHQTQTSIALSWTPAFTLTPTLTHTATFSTKQTATTNFVQTQISEGQTATAAFWTKTPTVTSTPTTTCTPSNTFTTPPTPLSPGIERIDPMGVNQVWVPAGTFMMGSDPTRDSLAQPDEQPQHQVTITHGFWFDEYEVTNAAYLKFVVAGGYKDDKYWSPGGLRWKMSNNITGPNTACMYDSRQPDQPRICISYYEAEAYANWRNGRLPTEAEWEYAARGTDGRIFPWMGDFDLSKANMAGSGTGQTTIVGSYKDGKSWINAYDLAGNAWEWVNDWYGPYPNRPQTDPTGPEIGDARVLRGGSHWDSLLHARAASRSGLSPLSRAGTFGFRVLIMGSRSPAPRDS